MLYNLARALEENSTGAVVLVEAFFDCIRVVQAEHVCVALIAVRCRRSRSNCWSGTFGRWLSCWMAMKRAEKRPGKSPAVWYRGWWVRAVEVPDGSQSDQLSLAQVQALLQGL